MDEHRKNFQTFDMSRMRRAVQIGISCLLFSSPVFSQTTNTAIVPAPQNSWMERHELLCKVADAGVGDVVFLGDSITTRWAAEPLFNKEFGKYKAQNFGIGGDRTENVLWRLQHGALSNIRPKVIVLLIGTNNLTANTVPEIAAGVEAIIKEIKARSPKTKILLLGVFPRDEKPGTDLRKKIDGTQPTARRDMQTGRRSVFWISATNFWKPTGRLHARR